MTGISGDPAPARPPRDPRRARRRAARRDRLGRSARSGRGLQSLAGRGVVVARPDRPRLLQGGRRALARPHLSRPRGRQLAPRAALRLARAGRLTGRDMPRPRRPPERRGLGAWSSARSPGFRPVDDRTLVSIVASCGSALAGARCRGEEYRNKAPNLVAHASQTQRPSKVWRDDLRLLISNVRSIIVDPSPAAGPACHDLVRGAPLPLELLVPRWRLRGR